MSRRSHGLSAAAQLDLLRIWNYLAEHESSDIADAVIADIKKGIQQLIRFPGHGHRRLDLTRRDLWFYRVHSYFIIYRKDLSPLRIARVLHTSRDIKTLLE